MKYLFWKLDELGHDGWKEVLKYCLRKSDNFNITHSVKEEYIDGTKLYSIDSENTENDKNDIWRHIYNSAVEKGDFFFFEYEMNDGSKWVQKVIEGIPQCDIKEIVAERNHKVKVCTGVINKEAKEALDKMIINEQLGYDEFDWHVEIIDNKIKRTLFAKLNSRKIVNGRGYVNTELTEEEIDDINGKGYIVDNIIDYKRRYTINKPMEDRYSKIIEEEALIVSQGEIANLRTIKLYKGERKLVSTDLEYYFNLCLNEEEMAELKELNISTDGWTPVMEKEGYIAPNYYMSNECRTRLNFNLIELDVRKIEEAVENFFERLEVKYK